MNTKEVQSSPSELMTAHRVLLTELSSLEEFAGAAVGAVPGALSSRLQALRGVLGQHFQMEEANGYLSVVMARAPHLHRSICQLLAEHRELERGLDLLIAETGQAPLWTEALGDRLLAWGRSLRDHERRENLLVEDAFDVDIGAED